jgi:Ni,Fe-hydrogenase I cytochrome b subunit
MTDIKLIHVLLLFLSLLIKIYHVFMVLLGNILSQLSTIELFNGGNYGSWRETIEIALAL